MLCVKILLSRVRLPKSFVNKEVQKNRTYLRNVMVQHGFKDYEKEWWHYTFAHEPYPTTYFDFLVQYNENG